MTDHTQRGTGSRYEIFFQGEKLATATIDSIQINQGVMPWMFKE